MRRCTTVPGFGACCRAAQAGLLGQPFRINTARGQRCMQCDIITKRNGSPGFRARFHKSVQCGIGPGGCPALAQAGPGGGQMLQLPGSPTGGGFAQLP